MIWPIIFTTIIISLLILYSKVSKKDARYILWPEYFDNSISRCGGRRVPSKLAVASPTIEDIAKAAKRLKLHPKLERNKAYPSRWWCKSGRVFVLAKEKKTKIIKRIAIKLKKSKKK